MLNVKKLLQNFKQLSNEFGGISIHCCANAEHQLDGFANLPGLKYINLMHPVVSLEKAVNTFMKWHLPRWPCRRQ